MNISLRQLKGFLLVAQLSSFTRAAEQLHITQAGLSAMMRDLEAQFACRLFDRTTRTVSLTREGEALYPTAELVVQQLEQAGETVKQFTSVARRVLSVAVTHGVAASLIPFVCRAFMNVDPAVEVRIRDVKHSDIQRLVESTEVDVGFGIYMKPAAGIELEPLLKFDLLYISARSNPTPMSAQKIQPITWSDVALDTLITLPDDTPVQQAINSQLIANGRTLVSRQICNSMQTIIAMVGQGLGCTIMPSMILPSCPSSRFQVQRLIAPNSELDFYCMTKKGHEPSPSTAPFVKVLKEVVTRLSAQQPT